MPALDEEDVEAQRGRARSQSTSKWSASQDTPKHSQRWRWSESIARSSMNSDQKRSPRTGHEEHSDVVSEKPCKWPPERICFILGMVLFPLWILGAFWRWRHEFEPYADLHKWRCQVLLMMASVIMIGLMVVEVAFRET